MTVTSVTALTRSSRCGEEELGGLAHPFSLATVNVLLLSCSRWRLFFSSEMCSGCVLSTAWNPDGTLLVSGDEDGVIKAWTPEGENVRDFVGHS